MKNKKIAMYRIQKYNGCYTGHFSETFTSILSQQYSSQGMYTA